MSDKTQWLGYFVGWEHRPYDLGIGADGNSSLFIKEKGKRVSNKQIEMRYLIEEEIDGKWVTRKFLSEDGLASPNKEGIDPKNPVVLVTTVTGDTKVEWTHLPSGDSFTLIPKLIEKKTENKIRVGVRFNLPSLYRFDEVPNKRELKAKVGGDYVIGIRLKDKKKVRAKFTDLEDDIMSEEFLKDGASSVEVRSGGIADRTFLVENSSPKAGRIDLITKGPLHKSFKVLWMANMEKLGEKETSVTFSVE